MYQLYPSQIKAARAILDWSQEDLAVATGLSVNTIRNIEMGYISPRLTTNNVIRKVVENAGLEFTEGEGVKRRNDAVTIYQGHDGYEKFLDHVEQTIKKFGGDIGIIIKSPDILRQLCGLTDADGVQRLEELSKIAKVKCLLSEMPEPSFIIPSFQFRMTSKLNIGPLPGFVYANRYASILIRIASVPEFVVFKLADTAQVHQNYFQSLWENSQPIFMPENRQQKQLIEA